MSFYCVAEEVGAANLLEYCSNLISIHWDELLPQDFVHMSGALLYKMLKSKTKYPLHAAIRLRREDVVFLCLVENETTVSHKQHKNFFFYYNFSLENYSNACSQHSKYFLSLINS